MTDPRPGIVVQPRVLLVGGVVALVGVAVLSLFLWMVPKGAEREAVAACRGLHGEAALNPAVCDGNKNCTLPHAAPDFTALDVNGNPVKLSSLRGKVVLLNFWASWCGVCKTEKPRIMEMAEEMAGKDFVVVALASDHTSTDALTAVIEALAPNVHINKGQEPAAFKQAFPEGLPFKVWIDPPAGDSNIGQIAASWGITAVPESALIDRNGNIRAYFVNKRDWQSDVAETCLRSVIDERSIDAKD